MFALHETTQRRVCRVSFLLLCVVPTLLTIGGISYFNRPWRNRDWQDTLTSSLHLRAEVDQVAHPRPGMTVLSNLHLADLQTDAPLGWTEQLFLRQHENRLLLTGSHLELHSDQLGRFINALTTWCATEAFQPLSLHIEQLSVTSNTWPALSLKKLQMDLNPSGQNSQKIHLVAQTADGRGINVELQVANKTLHSQINLQHVALPAWLIGELVPGLQTCGTGKFSGMIETNKTSQTSQGKLVGSLSAVDVSHWNGTASHQLKGIAQIELKQVDWQDESLEFAQGSVTIDRGAATFSLLVDMKDKLLLTPGPALQQLKPASPGELIPFEKLAVGFKLSHSGIALSSSATGQLAIGADGPLLVMPQPHRSLPVAQIIQLFHTPKQGWLPDTQAAHAMAGKFPLPGNKESNTPTNRQ